MNRVPSFLFFVAMAAIALFCGGNRVQAQDPDSFAHASGPDPGSHASRKGSRR